MRWSWVFQFTSYLECKLHQKCFRNGTGGADTQKLGLWEKNAWEGDTWASFVYHTTLSRQACYSGSSISPHPSHQKKLSWDPPEVSEQNHWCFPSHIQFTPVLQVTFRFQVTHISDYTYALACLGALVLWNACHHMGFSLYCSLKTNV